MIDTPCAGSEAYCVLDSIVPLLRFLIAVLYIYIYILFACFYHMFPHFFLTYLFPYLSFPLRIDPLRFQAGCCKRRLNVALVFLSSFCVVVRFV